MHVLPQSGHPSSGEAALGSIADGEAHAERSVMKVLFGVVRLLIRIEHLVVRRLLILLRLICVHAGSLQAMTGAGVKGVVR